MTAERVTVGVTGANGFVGSRLVEGLREEGYDAVPSVHSQDSLSVPPGTGYEVVDVLDAERLREVHGDVDVLVHLAGITGVENCASRPEDAFRVNVQGTENVSWLCRERGIPLVFTSSIAVVGQPDAPQVSPDHPRRPTSLYGLTKAMSEEDVERLSDGRFPAYVARIANVYGSFPFGPVSFTSVVDHFVSRAIDDGTITVHAPGTQRRDFVYVDDVVEALLRAVDRIRRADPGTRILPIATGTSRSILEVAELVSDVVLRRRGDDSSVTIVDHDENSEVITDFEIDTAATVDELSFEPSYDVEAGLTDLLRRAE